MPTEVELAVRHGPYTFRVKGDSLKTALTKLAALQEIPPACPRCGASIRFVYRTREKYVYYGLACLGDEPHMTDLGIYQDDPRELFYSAEKPWLTRAEIANLRREEGG